MLGTLGTILVAALALVPIAAMILLRRRTVIALVLTAAVLGGAITWRELLHGYVGSAAWVTNGFVLSPGETFRQPYEPHAGVLGTRPHRVCMALPTHAALRTGVRNTAVTLSILPKDEATPAWSTQVFLENIPLVSRAVGLAWCTAVATDRPGMLGILVEGGDEEAGPVRLWLFPEPLTAAAWLQTVVLVPVAIGTAAVALAVALLDLLARRRRRPAEARPTTEADA